jgi:uncharacterized protein (TIGR02246 family)
MRVRVGSALVMAVVVCGVAGMCGCHSGDAQPLPAGSTTSAVAQPAAGADGVDPRITEETNIRALDADLTKAFAASDSTKAAAFYDESATVMVPGQSAAEGRDHIAREFMALMAMPGFAFTFTPDTVMVAKSGEMAYENGEYSMTLNDRTGTPQVTKARYVVVWTKAADGSWKILIDAPTTTK